MKSLGEHKTILENFSWMTALELFMLVAPLITYPYLVRVLGMELYGLVLTAQVLTSYAAIIIDFGSNTVVTKQVSICRDDKDALSEIVCSVFIVRSVIWLMCLPVFCGVVFLVPSYRAYWSLFLISYGLTFNDVLFPRYFFQGIEKMRISSLINIGIKLLFILLVFVVVRKQEDYLFVPALYTFGYTLAGLVSMYIIFGRMKIRFYVPPVDKMMFYVKESSSIFATDLICTIKDRFNYFLLGGYSGMANVVVYDLGIKLNLLLGKPAQITSQVFLPRFSKSKDVRKLRTMTWLVFAVTLFAAIVLNIFMPWVVGFFLDSEIDLLPLRIFSLAPVLLAVSGFLANNFFIAFGHNRYLLYSILVTTSAYLLALLFVILTDHMSSVYSFVGISLFSYFVEFLYRIIMKSKLIRKGES